MDGSFWLWVPILVAVPMAVLLAWLVRRSTAETRRTVNVFVLGFVTCALFSLVVQHLVRYLGDT